VAWLPGWRKAPTSGPGCEENIADRWAPQMSGKGFNLNPEINSKHRKNIYKSNKNPGNIVEVGNLICNTFQYCNVFQISTDFELFKRF
jgi:hypothetical protein